MKPIEDRGSVRWSLRVAVASVLVGAAAIHFAMAPSHLAEWPRGGAGFLVAAWLQAGVALLVLLRPSRHVWLAAIALNAGLVALWAVSRTTGLPVGPDRGEAEPVTVVDLAAVALELAAIVGAIALLASPGWLRPAGARVTAAIVSVGAIALTTTALASPSARDHALHGHSSAAHDDSPVADNGLATISHSHGAAASYRLDPATRRKLRSQLALAREAAERWPTLADALRDGYRRAGPYVPGQGLHMGKLDGQTRNHDGVMDARDLRHPAALMYMSADPSARPVGLLYHTATGAEPEGFAGRTDGWHLHRGICLVERTDGSTDTPFGSQRRDEDCKAFGGTLRDRRMWMVHVWVMPGFDSVKGGTFASKNPQLGCSDGTYFMVPPDDWDSHPLNVCRSGESKVLPVPEASG